MATEPRKTPIASTRVCDRLSDAAELLLANSALLGDLDLESEAGGMAAVERLETKKESIEWSALLVTTFAQLARDAIHENDPTKAAWATQQAMLAHAVLTFERDLKDLVWRGYGNFGADQITDALAPAGLDVVSVPGPD